MHKFYWNNTQRSGSGGATASSVASNAAAATSSQKISLTSAENCQADQYNMDLSAVNIRHGHPEVPARAYGATASIKVEQRDQRATTPSGSHRVLLKLKKMSNRPKSMHENDQPPNEANVTTTTTKSKLPSSKSMHQFYNRTWNERSLSKYSREAGNSHNYENVYSNNYDDYFGSTTATRSDNCDGCVINQLTCSPRSGRRSFAPPQPDYSVPPVPPERKGRGRKRAEKPLFRSKSCERPKMRDTFRVGSEKFAANFNRISSNITDKILHFQQENPHNESEMSREISTVSNNSILQSVALRAIPCVDIQGSSQNGSGGGHYYRDSRDRERPPTKSPSSDHDLDNISDLSMPTRPPTASSNSSTTSRPSLALAHKMKGIRKDMQQKISRLRSRSAERISKRILHRQKSSSNDNENVESESENRRQELEDQKPVFRMNRSFSGLPMYNQVHNGPFIGRARALVDYTPSPYDRDALRFNRGDTIEIIAMNPSGLWQGKSQGRIGHFKFINVELLPDRNTLRQQRRSASEKVPNYTNSGPPKTVEELLKRIGLEEHLSVFVLNGYEELENFHDLDESELDYLGITENEQRAKILAAVELLQDSNTSSAATISDDDDTERNVITEDASQNQFERHKFPRDSGCFASSSPASDRSSQQSHSESGIHDFEMDESLPSSKQRSSPEKSSSAQVSRRSLRDRHTLNTHELQILNLNGSPPNRKDSFEVLVEKYVTEKTPLEHGRVRDARNIFENGCN